MVQGRSQRVGVIIDSDPQMAYEVNYLGSINLAKAAIALSILSLSLFLQFVFRPVQPLYL